MERPSRNRARSQVDERGASLVEYALLIALIALTALVGVEALGRSVGDQLDRGGSSLVDAGS